MKMLLIGPLPFPIIGSSFANEKLIENLIDRSVRCDVINTSTKGVSSKQGTKFSFKKSFSFFHTYLEIYKIFSSTIVYTTPGQTFFGVLKYSPFYLLCIFLKKPYIIHLHGNYLGQEYKNLLGLKKIIFKFFLKNAKAGIVLSESLRNNFDSILPREQIYVVENFVDKSLFLSESLIKSSDKLRIIYLSNLMPEKGILDLLDALSILKDRGIEFEAILAGEIEKSNEENILLRISRLGDCVRFTGPVVGKMKKDLLFGANVFVLPTYYKMEGQPISLLEGLATGNIIVTTKHAGIPDIISQKNGFLTDTHSPEDIANNLEYIQKNLLKCVNEFSISNISYATLNFTETRFTQKIIDILYDVSKAQPI